jgi:hypothetical protein
MSMGWMTCIKFPARADIFLLDTVSRLALGLIQWRERAFSPGVKWPRAKADHTNAEVKNSSERLAILTDVSCGFL